MNTLVNLDQLPQAWSVNRSPPNPINVRMPARYRGHFPLP